MSSQQKTHISCVEYFIDSMYDDDDSWMYSDDEVYSVN